jgi:large subunit ribosomal protein L19
VNLLDQVNQAQRKADASIPKFNVGDTVRVHFRIVEGEKERVQVYEGVVIGRHGSESHNATFTVRRVAFGVGDERVFPIHSPRVEGVQVVREGQVRRAPIYYIRDLSGKAARVKAKQRSTSTKGKKTASAQTADIATPAAE